VVVPASLSLLTPSGRVADRVGASGVDDQEQRPAPLRRLLLRLRLRARLRQRGGAPRGAARLPTWARGQPPAFAPRGYLCGTRPETWKARHAGRGMREPVCTGTPAMP
jgi:hypothetical protein